MTKVILELDFDNEVDRKILEVVSKIKAAQAQGKDLDSINLADSLPPEERTTPSQAVANYKDSAKEVTKAANQLGKLIGANSTMTTVERARVAAQARWARIRAEKEGIPLPPKLQKKKSKSDTSDYSRAEREEASAYAEQPADDITEVLNRQFRSSVPDGREIMDGRWRKNAPEVIEEDDAEVDEDFDAEDDGGLDHAELREIRERAKSYDR